MDIIFILLLCMVFMVLVVVIFYMKIKGEVNM